MWAFRATLAEPPDWLTVKLAVIVVTVVVGGSFSFAFPVTATDQLPELDPETERAKACVGKESQLGVLSPTVTETESVSVAVTVGAFVVLNVPTLPERLPVSWIPVFLIPRSVSAAPMSPVVFSSPANEMPEAATVSAPFSPVKNAAFALGSDVGVIDTFDFAAVVASHARESDTPNEDPVGATSELSGTVSKRKTMVNVGAVADDVAHFPTTSTFAASEKTFAVPSRVSVVHADVPPSVTVNRVAVIVGNPTGPIARSRALLCVPVRSDVYAAEQVVPAIDVPPGVPDASSLALSNVVAPAPVARVTMPATSAPSKTRMITHAERAAFPHLLPAARARASTPSEFPILYSQRFLLKEKKS
jgi:hypothetical protein